MATCKDCLHYGVCTFHITENEYKRCPHYAPTAGVVPRSEVDWHREAELNAQRIIELEAEKDNLIKNYAECMREYAREIFEGIEERIATHAFTSKSEDYADGMFDAIEWVDSKIAELKKKYTEEGG